MKLFPHITVESEDTMRKNLCEQILKTCNIDENESKLLQYSKNSQELKEDDLKYLKNLEKESDSTSKLKKFLIYFKK